MIVSLAPRKSIGDGSTTVSLEAGALADDLATIVVSDNGTGFEPNMQNKQRGLGLVRRLVEQVRGTVAVTSGAMTSNPGTTWTVRVPRDQAVTAALGI